MPRTPTISRTRTISGSHVVSNHRGSVSSARMLWHLSDSEILLSTQLSHSHTAMRIPKADAIFAVSRCVKVFTALIRAYRSTFCRVETRPPFSLRKDTCRRASDALISFRAWCV